MVTTTVALTKPSERSGNPGYIVGRNIVILSSLSIITNPSNGNCLTAASNNISIPFGVQQTYSCVSASPCTNAFYIDSLPSLSISLQKYANDASTITVDTSGSSSLGCQTQTYTLDIVYTYDGW